MMPWWFWVLLWLFLLSGSALFLVLCGIRLYRGVMRLLDDVGESADRLQLGPLDAVPDGGEAGGPGNGPAAVFRDPAQVRSEYVEGKAGRREARRVRRVEGKKRRGQPQRIRDLHLP